MTVRVVYEITNPETPVGPTIRVGKRDDKEWPIDLNLGGLGVELSVDGARELADTLERIAHEVEQDEADEREVPF